MKNLKSASNSTKATSIFANLSPNRHQQLSNNQFDDLSNKESFFLKVKNRQLQEGAIRLAQRILQLQISNEQLLKINQKYISALNQQFTHKHDQFEQQMKKIKNHPFCKYCNRTVLNEFQKDYRNLVKYTFILKDEIMSKNVEIDEYNKIKKQLSRTNHTGISTLINQLIDTTGQVAQLKKQLNRVQFQLQKSKGELQRIKRNNKESKQTTNMLQQQLEKYKSLINTIKNQSIDKQRMLNQKIYQQQLVIQNIQKEMRQSVIMKDQVIRKHEELRVQNLQLNLRSNKRCFSQSKVIATNKSHNQQTLDKDKWLIKLKTNK